MAQQALGPGATVPRRRVLFGLLDAGGWAWAGLKAGFWLIVIIFMLGYLPDRAYYFTVNRTIDIGKLAQRQARDGADAEDEQQERHHRREDGSSHRQVGNHHLAILN